MRMRWLAYLSSALALTISFGGRPASCATIASTWNGGTGTYSTASDWTPATVPNNGSDVYNVTIASGVVGGDTVDLDINPTVQSLTLGSASGSTSLLQNLAADGTQGITTVGDLTINKTGEIFLDNNSSLGVGGNGANSGSLLISHESLVTVSGNLTNSGTLTTNANNDPQPLQNGIVVNGTLTNQASGNITIGAYDDTDQGSGGDFLNVGTLANSGNITVGKGASLTVTNGISDIAAGSNLTVNGTVTGLGSLATVEGTLELGNQATTTVTGPVTNSGQIYVGDSGTGGGSAGTVLDVTGDLTNSNIVQVEKGGTLTVGGTFTNKAGSSFEVGAYGPANANVNALSLAGTLQIDSGSTMNITGGGPGITDVAANTTLIQNGTFEVSGTTNALANLATVEGTLELGNQATTTVTGPVTNSGQIYVGDSGTGGGSAGTVLDVTGNLTNSNIVQVEKGGTLTVGGTFTNKAGSSLEVGAYGPANANVNALSLAGTLQIDSGSTMNITGGGSGITDVAANTTLIQNGTFEVSGTTNALANLATVEGTLELGNQATTTVTGSVTNTGQIYIGDSGTGGGSIGTVLDITGNLTNSHIIQVEYGANLTVGGTFTNQSTGSFEVGAYGAATSNLNTLSNSGSVQVDIPSTLTVNTLNNSSTGTVLVASFGYGAPPTGATLNATTLTNNGLLTIGNGTSGGTAVATVNASTLSSGGTVTVTANGLLNVGSGSGGATSGYQEFANGTLAEMIFGAAAGSGNTCMGSGDCGIINVAGAVNLNGTLDPVLENSFDPTNGESFIFLTFTGALNGTFSNIENQYFNNDTQQWMVTYGGNYVELTAEAYSSPAAPEPATLWLMAAGLIGLGFAARRRSAKQHAHTIA